MITTSTVTPTVDSAKTRSLPRAFLLALSAVLGLGPFAIDMYLASLPQIGEQLAAPAWLVQLTLTGYLVMLGVGQLVAGPITDALGRRRPLLVGLALFVIGSLVAAAAPGIGLLVVARMVQGAGAAMAFVVVNSAVRDRATGDAATAAFALLMTISAVVPMISPALGGFIGGRFGWRAVFVALAVLGAVILAAAWRWVPETLPAAERGQLAFGPVLRAYAEHLRSVRLLLPLAAIAGAFIVLFCYLGGASYVYQGHYGVSQERFGLVFAATGISALLGSGLARVLTGRMSTPRLGLLGIAIMAVGSALALLAAGTGQGLLVVAAGVSLVLLGVGAAEPAYMALCMSAVERNAGAASALVGAAQYLLGAATTALIAFPATAGPAPWAVVMVVVSLASAIPAVMVARGRA